MDFESKKLATKIVQDACAAGAEFSEEFYAIISRINSLAAKISSTLDYNTAYEPLDSWDALIKSMGFHADKQGLDFPERILEYIGLNRRFFNKRLFVFYNLKALLKPEEAFLFYRNALYGKFSLLLVEDCQRYSVPEYENIVIVDKDLCVF